MDETTQPAVSSQQVSLDQGVVIYHYRTLRSGPPPRGFGGRRGVCSRRFHLRGNGHDRCEGRGGCFGWLVPACTPSTICMEYSTYQEIKVLVSLTYRYVGLGVSRGRIRALRACTEKSRGGASSKQQPQPEGARDAGAGASGSALQIGLCMSRSHADAVTP